MNNWNGIGRLARDPELRYTANNFPMCRFSIAIDRMGKEEKKTNFIPIKVLGNNAENCAKYLAKGRLVSVSGSIETDSYMDKEGNRKTTWEVLAHAVEFLERAEKTTEEIRQNINQTLGIDARLDDFPF